MGTPFKSSDAAGAASILQTAMCEVTSAVSALNMQPRPKEAPADSMGFLSETDEWAAHSVEHLRSVMEELRKLHAKLEAVRFVVLRHAQGATSPTELFDKVMDLINGENEWS